MRLIDADETIRIWDGCEITGSITPIINARPTVEAIPIDWMLNDWDSKEYADVGYHVMRRIIADWVGRKEG